ncbi:DUF309 domain-containing protein [Paenibacillus sp. J31TS4]|uniref:DUF309 domain-containing protein n=1 Tax=Paenibacillus sp. J31TS4 TaxID=2807195 RepID=UPI001BD17953|nr:DUF309 domain-containing protein [Paenibacillus sp. J31TS4]
MLRKEPNFIAFLYFFNEERDYFECHEVMEELWLEHGRHPLLQGLLQVAVGLYHCRNGNGRGARKLLRQAADKLERYPADALGLELDTLLGEVRTYLAGLAAAGDDADAFGFYDLTIRMHDGVLEEQVRAYAARRRENGAADAAP